MEWDWGKDSRESLSSQFPPCFQFLGKLDGASFLWFCLILINFLVQKLRCKDFPGIPVVRTSPSSAGDAVRSLVREVELHMPCHQKKEKKKTKKQKQYCNKFNKAFKKKLRCSRGKLSGCYKLLPSAFRGLWAFWELQRKGVLSVLFTGGSALSQDEGEGWYPCAEHPLCKQGLALHQSSHLALVGWSGNHDSRLPPPGGDKIFSRH